MKQYFPALTGFRAIAAWLVFAHHYNPFPKEQFISAVVNEGYIGVSLFFVLSGFLITVRYDGTLDLKEYVRNRVARIYPLYFLLTTLTFVVLGGWGWTYIANITFLKGFFDELKFTGISQGWSLTVEEMFYLLAPLIFVLIRNNKLAWLLPLVFAGIGATIYYRSLDFMLVYTFFGRSFDFFVGIALAKNYHRIKIPAWIGGTGILLTLVLLALVRGNELYGVLTLPGLLIHHLLVPVSTALLLAGLINETFWLQKLLSSRPMLVLGKSSYAFYLVHVGVIAAWLPLNVVVLFLVLNAIAVGLYYGVERPLHSAVRGSAD